MIRLIDADALKRRLIKRREEIASERRYGWEWEYNGLNCAILLTGCEAVENPIRPEPHWIPCSERLPENNDPVNVTWVNHNPEVYYMDIKDKPYTATAIYFRGRWFWYSCVIEDWLAEYGSNESFLANLQEAVDRDIEITAWQPLPEPYKGVTDGND